MFMIYIIIFAVLSILWFAFEMWRAPVGEETENGYREIRPTKKLRDLWRKQS